LAALTEGVKEAAESLMQSLVYYYPQGHAEHYEAGHPERPERVEAIRRALQVAGWWEPYPRLSPAQIPGRVLQAVHSAIYLEQLEQACRASQHLDGDTYTTPASWEIAHASAGGALAVAWAVWAGEARRGFALTRPPGHHATRKRGMGFCLLNHIAIAAEALRQDGNAKRLAIVDLDLHHGNGTQDIFWECGEVLYISTHQWPLYPGTGRLEETGAGDGQGATANIPLPPGSGDLAFQTITHELILPLLTRFEPEILLVSFGFDPHWLDPLGHLQLSASGYRSILSSLATWADDHCGGKIALFLEGGYDLDAGAACAQAAVSALLGLAWKDPLGASSRPEGKTWQAVLKQAQSIWGL
jgi:acetoin utilization deacetylase AcuC-like enzyme